MPRIEIKPPPRKEPLCTCGHRLNAHSMLYGTCFECECKMRDPAPEPADAESHPSPRAKR